MADLSNYRRGSVEFENFGQFQASVTVQLPPLQEADSILFSFPWETTENADFVCAITRLRLEFQQTSNHTAAILDERFEVFVGREATVLPTGGAPISTIGNNLKRQAADADSRVENARYSTTSTGLVAGTYTLDTLPIMTLQTHVVKTLPTAPLRTFTNELNWQTAGAHPLILEQNEILIVCGPSTAFGMAGTANLNIEIEWAELGEY